MPKRGKDTRPAVSTAPAGKPGPKADVAPRQSFGRWAWDWIKSLAAGFVLFLFVRAFILQTWVITSGSMEETLLVGDLLVLNKVAYGAQLPGTEKRLPGYTAPKHGDVVVFRAHHQPLDVIKRIIGTPGDTLQMRDKELFINGKKQIEPYVRLSDPEGRTDAPNEMMMEWQPKAVIGDSAFRANYEPTRDNWGPVVVPAGHFFMMGDNRDDSLDSRYWGFLNQNRVKGKAEVVYYSYDKESMEPFAWIREARWTRIGDRIR